MKGVRQEGLECSPQCTIINRGNYLDAREVSLRPVFSEQRTNYFARVPQPRLFVLMIKMPESLDTLIRFQGNKNCSLFATRLHRSVLFAEEILLPNLLVGFRTRVCAGFRYIPEARLPRSSRSTAWMAD